MQKHGCFAAIGTLQDHYFDARVDVHFVFEINAFMQASARVVESRATLLYPCFELSNDQIANFRELGVAVMPDDGLVKPPNSRMHYFLVEAREKRARSQVP